MAYTISSSEWYKKVDEWCARREKNPKSPCPMRPIQDRTCWESAHFVIMTAKTTAAHWGKGEKPRVGSCLALIEKAGAERVTRIDKRLKSVKQIIAIRFVRNHNHRVSGFIQKRNWKQLHELGRKCEELWPCHFLLKEVNYVPPKETTHG